jgi:hypothetical protein
MPAKAHYAPSQQMLSCRESLHAFSVCAVRPQIVSMLVLGLIPVHPLLAENLLSQPALNEAETHGRQ